MKCSRCHKDKPDDGNGFCRECLDGFRLKRSLAKANGICPRCFKNKPVYGKSSCQSCLAYFIKRKESLILYGKCACGRQPLPWKKICHKCSMDSKARGMSGRAAKRDTVFSYYGNKCECCGESNTLFLTIDHIDGGGSKHRREIKTSGGIGFYRWLIKNNFPEGFRVLCFNCNCGRSRNGGTCPHEESPAVIEHMPSRALALSG